MNTAKWIWIDKNGPRKNCYARFFREFFIKPDEQNPTGEIRISVSDNYTLYLNGNFISCGQYKDYPDLKHYDCLKLDPFLQIGKNALAMMTISDHFVTGEKATVAERQNNFTDMMKLALEAAIK